MKSRLSVPGLLVKPPPPNMVQSGPNDFCIQIGSNSVTGEPRVAVPTGMAIDGKKATCGRQPSSSSSIKRYFTPAPSGAHTTPMPPDPGLGLSGTEKVNCVSAKAP